MAAPTPTAIPDKIDNTLGGMHSGVPPQLLSPNQLAFAVNVTNRGGRPKTRPAIRKIELSYSGEGTEENATEANFQVAGFYQGSGNNSNCLLSMIGGRVFRYLVTNNSASVQDVSTGLTDLNDPTLTQGWYWQGENFGILTNGQGLPLFWDGAGLRRSLGDAGKELPACAMGVYNNGRNIVVLPDRRSYIASDLVYSTASGTSGYNYRDSILKITNFLEILNGQPFAVPINAGDINALFAVAIPDTSLGQGPLQVGTLKGVFGVDLPLDATQWTTVKQPTQVVSLPSFGPTSNEGVAVINTDAWYRALDGIRSFQVGRRDMNTWVQTPLSFEMERVLPYDTQSLLGHASAVSFQNRLIMTCSPYRVTDRGIAHRGLIALDFASISSITSRAQPAYDGLWTGLPILQVITGEFNGTQRCFIFALDINEKICLYELTSDTGPDFDFDGEDEVRIESWIESNALWGLDAQPPQITMPLKKLINGALWVDEMKGDCQIKVYHRPDMYPFWTQWGSTFNLCATSCETPTDCSQPTPIQYQYATYQRLPQANDRDCNEVTSMPLTSGYFHQVKIAWKGHIELNKFIAWAQVIPETVPGCPSKACTVLRGCVGSLFTYSIESSGEGAVLEWSVDNGGSGAPTFDANAGSTIHPIT